MWPKGVYGWDGPRRGWVFSPVLVVKAPLGTDLGKGLRGGGGIVSSLNILRAVVSVWKVELKSLFVTMV